MSFTPSELTPAPILENDTLMRVPFMTHTAALWILRSNLEWSVSPSVRRSPKFVKSLQLMWDSLEPVMRKIDDQNEKVRLEHNARILAKPGADLHHLADYVKLGS